MRKTSSAGATAYKSRWSQIMYWKAKARTWSCFNICEHQFFAPCFQIMLRKPAIPSRSLDVASLICLSEPAQVFDTPWRRPNPWSVPLLSCHLKLQEIQSLVWLLINKVASLNKVKSNLGSGTLCSSIAQAQQLHWRMFYQAPKVLFSVQFNMDLTTWGKAVLT